MNTVTQILARILGQRGFADKVRQFGAALVLGDRGDLTESQAALIDECIDDPAIRDHIEGIWLRYDKLKETGRIKKSAEPWYGDYQLRS